MKRLVLLGCLALPVAAVAGGNDTREGDRKDGASAPRERLICRTESITRTRVRSHRTCRTQAEWDAQRAQSGEGGDRLQSHSRSGD